MTPATHTTTTYTARVADLTDQARKAPRPVGCSEASGCETCTERRTVIHGIMAELTHLLTECFGCETCDAVIDPAEDFHFDGRCADCLGTKPGYGE